MRTDEIIWKVMTSNMGYVDGEKVAIIYQGWNHSFEESLKDEFEQSREISQKFYDVLKERGVDVNLFSYVPEIPRNGVDVTPHFYEEYERAGFHDILMVPSVFSISHTSFRREQSRIGTRIASMPGLTLDFFEDDGPLDVGLDEMKKISSEIYSRIKRSEVVRIIGEGTDIKVEITPELVHMSSGDMRKKGGFGNLPGAEVFTVPKRGRKTEGYFTVPAGWGGEFPLKYKTTFHVKDGRFIDIVSDSEEGQEYIDEKIKPLFFDTEDFDVLAELGIGTNPKVTSEYIKSKGWNTLLAEKIFGSAHFANGNSKGMGGDNDVPIHIDWVVPNVTILYE